jgi:hypothetical protein
MRTITITKNAIMLCALNALIFSHQLAHAQTPCPVNVTCEGLHDAFYINVGRHPASFEQNKELNNGEEKATLIKSGRDAEPAIVDLCLNDPNPRFLWVRSPYQNVRTAQKFNLQIPEITCRLERLTTIYVKQTSNGAELLIVGPRKNSTANDTYYVGFNYKGEPNKGFFYEQNVTIQPVNSVNPAN